MDRDVAALLDTGYPKVDGRFLAIVKVAEQVGIHEEKEGGANQWESRHENRQDSHM